MASLRIFFSVDRFLGQSLPKAFCSVENALAMQFIEMKVLALRRRALEPQRSEFIKSTSSVSTLADSIVALVLYCLHCKQRSNGALHTRCLRQSCCQRSRVYEILHFQFNQKFTT